LLWQGFMRFVLLMCVAACTSSGGDVSGTTPGGDVDIQATVSAVVTTSDGGDSSSAAHIILSTNASVCADAGATPAIDRKGSRFIAITLMDVNGSTATAPAAAGTYTIYPNTGSQPPKEALLDTGGLDDTCQLVDDEQASGQSGTVVLDSAAGGAFKGTFDVVLNTGDHITGSFDPTPCPALQALTMGSEHACQ
jgi:hypothetical protein